MTECVKLLEAKDTLRGTAALNWDVKVIIGSWDGVTVAGVTYGDRTPDRVTKLVLPSQRLDGSIPEQLGA